MKRLFYKLHFLLSIPFGLIISLICFTGAALVFEKEITTYILNRDLHIVDYDKSMKRLTEDEIISSVVAQIGDTLVSPSLTFDENTGRSCQIKFSNTGRRILYVNPYNADILGWDKSYNFFKMTKRLHRWLLDMPAKKGEMTAGKFIVGISSVAMVVLVISGIVLWIPRSFKSARNRFKVCFSKGSRRLIYDFHVTLGFYASIFILVIVLTGLTWSFTGYRDFVFSMFPETYTFSEIKSLMYSIHVGRWGGILTKIIWFVVAMIAGMLPIVGYVIYFRKKLARRKREVK